MAEVKEKALRHAANNGYIDDVKMLIESGTNPNAANEVCCVVLWTDFVFTDFYAQCVCVCMYCVLCICGCFCVVSSVFVCGVMLE